MSDESNVDIPPCLNNETVLPVIKKINEFNKDKPLNINFTNTRTAFPGGLTPLLAQLLDVNCKTTIYASKNEYLENYITRMGFYDLLNIEDDYKYQRHDGTGRFQELYLFSSQTDDKELGKRKENVIKIFTQNQSNQNFIHAINWCIPELVDNAYTHSMANICVLFAQNYKKGAEFCIADRGVGIKETMGTSDILEALERCIRKEKGIKSEGQGNGLFYTSEYIKNDTSKTKSMLNIHSEDGIITIKSGDKTPNIQKVDSFWKGTIVTLKLYDNIETDISALLGYQPYGAEDLPDFYDIF